MSYDPGPAYRRTSGFRPPNRPDHHGVDFAAPSGTPIPAAADGEVWYSSENRTGGFGNLVILRHVGRDGSPFYTLYAHQDGSGMPAVGDMVQAREIIGHCGSTGNSSGPHVHFEVIDGAVPLRHEGPLGVAGRVGRLNPDTFNNWPVGAFVAATQPGAPMTAFAAKAPATAGAASSTKARKAGTTRTAAAPKSPGAAKVRTTAKKPEATPPSRTAAAKPGRAGAGAASSRAKSATKAAAPKAAARKAEAAKARTARAKAAAPVKAKRASSNVTPKPKAAGATSAGVKRAESRTTAKPKAASGKSAAARGTRAAARPRTTRRTPDRK